MKKHTLYLLLFLCFSTLVNAKIIEIKPDSVFLGQFENGSNPVLKVIEIKNISDFPIVIKSLEFIQNDENLFSSEQRPPVNIDLNGVIKIQFKFNPLSSKPGIKKAKYLLLVKEPEEERDTIIITAEIKAPIVKGFTSIYIPDIAAKVGEKFDLKVILDEFKNSADINRWSCKLSFNSTSFTPVSPNQRGKIEYNVHTINLSGKISNNIKSGDILISIPMIAGLGDLHFSEITLKDFQWFFNDRPVEHEIKIKNGIFELKDIYYENGIPRLISEKTENLNLEILENPATDFIKLKLFYNGKVKLFAYNLLGSFFRDFSSYVPYHSSQGYEYVTLNRQYFGTKGLYLIKLINQNLSATKVLFLD